MNYGEPMSQQNPSDVHSNAWCNLGMQDTKRLRRAYVTELRLRTSKNYYGLECFTPALLRASPVLLHITNCYSVLESTTPYYKVLRRTTNYFAVLILQSTTPYYKIL